MADEKEATTGKIVPRDHTCQLAETIERLDRFETKTEACAFFYAYVARPYQLVREVYEQVDPDQETTVDHVTLAEALKEFKEQAYVHIAGERKENIERDSSNLISPAIEHPLTSYLEAAACLEHQRRHPKDSDKNCNLCLEVVAEFYRELAERYLRDLITETQRKGNNILIPIHNFLVTAWGDNNESAAIIASLIVEAVTCGEGSPWIDEIEHTIKATANAAATAVLQNTTELRKNTGNLVDRIQEAKSPKGRNIQRRKTASGVSGTHNGTIITDLSHQRFVRGDDPYATAENITSIATALEKSGITEEEVKLLREYFPYDELTQMLGTTDDDTIKQLQIVQMMARSGKYSRSSIFPKEGPLRFNGDLIAISSLWRHYLIISQLAEGTDFTLTRKLNDTEIALMAEIYDHCPLVTSRETLAAKFRSVVPLYISAPGYLALAPIPKEATLLPRFFRNALNTLLRQQPRDIPLTNEQHEMRAKAVTFSLFPDYFESYPLSQQRKKSEQIFDILDKIRVLRTALQHHAVKSLPYRGAIFRYDYEQQRNQHLAKHAVNSLTVRNATKKEKGKCMLYAAEIELSRIAGGITQSFFIGRDFEVYIKEPISEGFILLNLEDAITDRLKHLILEHIAAVRLGPKRRRPVDDIKLPTTEENEDKENGNAEVLKASEKHLLYYFQRRPEGEHRPWYSPDTATFKRFIEIQERKGYEIPEDFFEQAIAYIEAERSTYPAIDGFYDREGNCIDSIIFRLMLTNGDHNINHFLDETRRKNSGKSEDNGPIVDQEVQLNLVNIYRLTDQSNGPQDMTFRRTV